MVEDGLVKILQDKDQQDKLFKGMWDELMQTHKHLKKLDVLENMLATMIKGKYVEEASKFLLSLQFSA